MVFGIRYRFRELFHIYGVYISYVVILMYICVSINIVLFVVCIFHVWGLIIVLCLNVVFVHHVLVYIYVNEEFVYSVCHVVC